MNFKHLTVGTAIVATLLLAACNGDNGNNNNAANTNASANNNSPVIATVNGEAIHENTLDALLNQVAHGRKVPPQAKQQLLNRLVQLKVLAQQARQQGIADQPDVQAEIQVQREALLAKALITQHMKQNPVSDEAVQAAYQKQIQSMDQKEYKARHILVNDKKTAEEVIAKLNNGANFAELAKKVSTGPSAKNGGELGWFSPSDMVAPFGKAVTQLKKGEYTAQPVKTQFGWHVILLEDVRPVPQPKLADMKASIKQQLEAQKVQDFVETLQKQASVDIKEEQFQAEAPAPQTTAAPAATTPTGASAMPAPATTAQPQAAASEG
ncbi:MAG TPA: peptidylprolyl isomerase [Gammaproteobacteria bacterium]|nr:peptidylprolyl isomerase [Gammaproteobacteria bacterium]